MHLLDIQRAEFESDYLIDQTLLPEKKRTNDINNVKELHLIINKAKELRDKYSTNTLNLNYFRLKSSLYEASFQYNELIEVCDEALSYFNTYPQFSLPARVGEFSLMKAIASSSMRHFHTANEMAQVCIQCFTRGGNNWYLALDIGYTAAMNAGDYNAAIEYHELAINDPRFATLPALMQERWTTYTAYLYLAKELGLISDSAIDFGRKFRLTSFLNSVPEFSKDKKYSNFLVIVSHICFLLIQKKYDDAERRAEYLRTYGLRYLKEDEFKRARVFIKLLLLLAKGISPNVYDDPFYTLLFEELRSSIHTTHGNEVNEIIPYELLTNRLIERILETR
jgi:tetratricopeptide (TPR) repeat protein